MISVPMFDMQGRGLSALDVDEEALGGKVRPAVMREAVQMYENNRHVCTKGTLTRGMVAGTTKKMYRQKHTGQARAGQKSAPHRRGGGVTFAPMTRDISWHMPRKARRTAARSALLSRLQDGVVSVVEEIALEAPRTKSIVALMGMLEVTGRCLIVVDGDHTNVWKSGRNIPKVTVRRAGDVNAYDLLNADRLLFTKAAFDRVMEALKA
jgi:large subunit ribosomal protein L4